MSDATSENNNNSETITRKFSWEEAIEDKEENIGSGKRRINRHRGLGFIDWLMILMVAIIIAGIAALLYLGWTFQVGSKTDNADKEWIVPVTGDFAPGRTKSDNVLFRLAGTKRSSAELMPEMVAAWMRARGYSGVINSTSNQIATIKGSKGGKEYRVLIALGSAKGGFEAFTQGRIEGVVSNRPIDASEADRLSALGDMTGSTNEKIIALGVSAVYVNTSNAISNMNGETLGRIMSGEITDWSEISDRQSGEIHIKVEDQGGDSGNSILDKLLGDRQLIDSVKSYPNAGDVIGAVSRDNNAIGFSHMEKNMGAVKVVAVHERNARAFEPNEFNVATEAYPFTERVHLYIGSVGADPSIRDFADFAISPAGQEVVKRVGLGAQQLSSVAYPAPKEAPRDYIAFASSARRMNFDFRFQQGANELDNKAIADLARLAAFMQKENIDQKRIALFGFADNVGAHQTNVGLAQSRAQTVLAELNEIGINPAVVRAYGEVLPVGANAFEAGRIKNRRVEVWVCPPPSCPLINIVEAPTETPLVPQGLPSGVRLGKPPKTPEGVEAPKG